MHSKYYQQIQVIMAVLGYYDGKCDGAWGPKSIEAMRTWEMQDDFEPAIPMNGKPFIGRGKLPDGISYSNAGLISEHLVSERALELLKTPLLCSNQVAKQCAGIEKTKQEKKAEYEHKEHITKAPEVSVQVDHTASAPTAQEKDLSLESGNLTIEEPVKDSWINKKK